MTSPTPEQRAAYREYAARRPTSDIKLLLEWGEAAEAEAAAWKEVADRTTVLLGECWQARHAAQDQMARVKDNFGEAIAERDAARAALTEIAQTKYAGETMRRIAKHALGHYRVAETS